jgi:hypothetical protein
MTKHTQFFSRFVKSIFAAFLLASFFLSLTGCASIVSRAATAEPDSAVAGCDAKNVTITGVHWFQDKGGAWRVVGIITNHTPKAISKLETGVETRTITDRAADQGEDIAAYPLNLEPGQQAPFTAWIARTIPSLDHFEVEIAECVLAEPAERSQVEVGGGQMVVDDTGTAHVTAELTNPNPKYVLINGLMAAVYDQAGVLITAQYADVTPRYLAPGESGPVRASLDLPKGAESKASTYKLFMDVLINQPDMLSINVEHDVQLLSRYVDREGHLHQIGQITNPGPKGIMTSAQAGIHAAQNKSQLVDAAQMATWVPIMPGETLTFDLTDWGPLNHSKSEENGKIKLDGTMDLRVEPFLTWTTSASVKDLSISDESVSYKDQQALFAGKVTNDSDAGITSGSVTAVLRQKSSGQIVTVGSAHLGITDSAAPGQVLYYSITVNLPNGADPADLTAEITAKGYQP